ncbi:MAG: helix-turn-helix domain-containing protein [Holosporaceae bacterium]|nr:helix-turn-helix domain-containing protein [Holosporaceae bacterium]
MKPQRRSLLFDDQPAAHTVAQLKGLRLRMARALTGFSRQELYEKIGIATSTIDTWESGRVELTEKSAARVSEAFRKVGILCPTEWLLTGEGDTPRMMRDSERSIFTFHEANIEQPPIRESAPRIPPFLDEDIRRELSFFISVHRDAIFHIVEADFVNSRYKKGDCVAGKIEDLESLEGDIIIAQLADGKTILCRLLHNVSNEESEVSFGKSSIPQRMEISKAAAVIWHRMLRIK